ncbi:hypothetical protein Ancab_028041 [Ancistrocladus abbreviatus]
MRHQKAVAGAVSQTNAPAKGSMNGCLRHLQTHYVPGSTSRGKGKHEEEGKDRGIGRDGFDNSSSCWGMTMTAVEDWGWGVGKGGATRWLGGEKGGANEEGGVGWG